MDHPQYSKLLPILATIPDPRKPRGKQLEWRFIWGVIAAALLCQHRSAAAIAQWAYEHTDQLLRTFQPTRGRVPSESTIRRALQRVNAVAVERQLLLVEEPQSPVPSSTRLQGQAIDGKHVRGAGAHALPPS